MKISLIAFLLVSFCSFALASPTPIPTKELFTSSSAASYSVSPESSFIVGYRRVNNLSYLEIVDAKTLVTKELYRFEEDEVLDSYDWVDNDTLLINLSRQHSKSFFLYFKFENGKVRTRKRIIKAKGEILQTLPAIDNKVLFAKNTGEDLDDVDIYLATTQQVYSANFRRAEMFDNELDNAFYYLANPDGEVILSVTFEEETFYYWVLDRKSNEWVRVHTIFNQDYQFNPIGILKNGNLSVLTDKNSNTVQLAEFDIKNKTFVKTIFEHPKYDLVGATLNADGTGIESVNYFDHGKLVTEFLNENNAQIYEEIKAKYKNKQILINSKNKDSSLVIFSLFSSNSSPSYHLYDKNKDKIIYLADTLPGLKDFDLTKSQSLSVKANKNLEIEAILTKPENGNGVLLVEPHGGPIGIRDINSFSRSTQFYASRGFSVLNVNFRGSSGFGKSFQNAGRGQFGKIIEHDISLVVDQVLKTNNFDKVCAIGTSYGGYSAMMLGIYKPDVYDCIISAYGVYDLRLLFNSSNTKTNEFYHKKVEHIVGKDRPALDSFSPFNLSNEVTQPVLLIAGKRDDITGFEQANRMKYALEQSDVQVETVFYENAGHGHHSWYGDRHEHAFIFDYLLRTLDIETPKSDTYQQALSDDFVTISEGYYYSNFIGKDPEKAFLYADIARTMGNARATFDVASYFHRGEVVAMDIDKALSLYRKSSENGYGQSSLRLGRIYREGKLVSRSTPISHQYFLLAKQQGNQEVLLEISNIYCNNRSPYKNLKSCIDNLMAMDLKRFDYKQSAFATELLSSLVWNFDLQKADKVKLEKMLNKVFLIDNINDFKVSPIREGLFYTAWSTVNSVPVINSRHEDKREIELIRRPSYREVFDIGLDYQLDPVSNNDSRRGLVKIKWTHPEMIVKSKGKQTQQKTISYIDLQAESEGKFSVKWQNKTAKGKWKVEIFNLYDQLLYQEEYTLH